MLKARFTITDHFPPVKMYVHHAGIEVWGTDVKKGVMESYLNGMENNPILKENAEYIIAGAWGNNGQRVIDLFMGSDVIVNWPGNPYIDIGFFVDGNYTKERYFCGDFNIVTGEEEIFRRGFGKMQVNTLDDFMAGYPDSRAYNRLFNWEPLDL